MYGRVLAGLVIGAAAICSGTPALAAVVHPASMSTSTTTEGAGIPETLRDSVEAVAPQLAKASGSLTWDSSASQLVVHYTGTGTAAISLAARLLPQSSYRLQQDTYSQSELASAATQVMEDPSNEAAHLTTVFPDPNGQGLIVTAAPDATLAISKLRSDYPIVQSSTLGYPEATSSRRDDTPSFYGGDTIFDKSANKGCTSGFLVQTPITGGTAQAMLTADHCGNIGDTEYANSSGTGAKYGVLSDGNSGGSDIKRISKEPYLGSVFTGSYTSSTGASVKGPFTPVVGDTVCTDGSWSGEVCGVRIKNADGIIDNSGTYYNQEVDITGSGGIVGNGDSGGPVIVHVSGGVRVGGVLSSESSNTVSCQGYPAGGGRTCSDEAWYANVYAFLNNNSGWSVATR